MMCLAEKITIFLKKEKLIFSKRKTKLIFLN